MNLYAKGKVLNQEGNIATIELSNEELGRAVLNYVVNNADRGIGERFMQNLFAGKPMSLNDLLMGNMVEAKKMSEKQSVECNLKKNFNIEEEAEGSVYESVKYSSEDSSEYTKEEKKELLLEQKSMQVKIIDIKEKCESVYERIVKTKNGISTQIISKCDIVFTFAENNVTYCFINYKNGKENVITPNNNLVFIWDDADSKELDELISLI